MYGRRFTSSVYEGRFTGWCVCSHNRGYSTNHSQITRAGGRSEIFLRLQFFFGIRVGCSAFRVSAAAFLVRAAAFLVSAAALVTLVLSSHEALVPSTYEALVPGSPGSYVTLVLSSYEALVQVHMKP